MPLAATGRPQGPNPAPRNDGRVPAIAGALSLAHEITRMLTIGNIESFNARVRKLINGKGHFPSDDAAIKVIYLAVVAAEKRWTRRPKDWAQAINQLALHFEGRVPL